MVSSQAIYNDYILHFLDTELSIDTNSYYVLYSPGVHIESIMYHANTISSNFAYKHSVNQEILKLLRGQKLCNILFEFVISVSVVRL